MTVRGDQSQIVFPSGVTVLVLAGASLVTGLMVASVPIRFLLLAGIAGLLAAPLLKRGVSGQIELLEPIVLANLALGVMFVARPLALLVADEALYLDRFDISSTFDEALLVALIGCLAYTLGYGSSIGQRFGRRLPAPPADLHRDTAWMAAWILIGVGLLAYTFYALRAGTSPLTILGGGVPPSPESRTTAYLYEAPNLILPALLLFMYVGTAGHRGPSLGAVLVGVGLLGYALASSGQRLGLLLLVSCVVVYPMLRSGWRPRTLTLLVLLPAGLLMFNAMRDVSRTEGSLAELGSLFESTIRSPSRTWTQFTLGSDTEMFSALAVELQLVSESLHHEPGSAILSLIARPVPRALWSEKPGTSDEVLNLEMGQTTQRGAAGVAFSILGGFYYDSGLVGVAGYMFCVGVGLRALYSYLVSNRNNATAQMVYASMLALSTIVLMRGNLAHPASFLLFTAFPLMIVSWLASRRSPREQRGHGEADVSPVRGTS